MLVLLCLTVIVGAVGRLHSSDLSPFPASLKWVEVGCGGGILTESLARLGANVLAIDAEQQSLEAARRHSSGQAVSSLIARRGGSITHAVQTAEELAGLAATDEDKLFDVVVSSEVIEHVNNPVEFARSLSSITKVREC